MTSVTGVLPTTSATGAPRSTASALNTQGIKTDFLKLLIAQLQNQDPLNPMDNAEFTSQLSQFSMVESLQNIQKSLDKMSASGGTASLSQSTGLLGHTVRTASGVSGVVTGLGLENGSPVVMLGEQSVPLADIVEIHT
jgi:flagellar basal-body rod modification protein FlgD